MESTWTWIAVGGGHLAIGHRPKVKALGALAIEGCTHVLTLLSEREGALALRDAVNAAGLVSLWLPLASGDPADAADDAVRAALKDVRQALMGGGRVFVHCSAGIHRTGMIAFALLRSLGIEHEEALAVLGDLRAVTAEGVGRARRTWADRFGGRGRDLLRRHPLVDQRGSLTTAESVTSSLPIGEGDERLRFHHRRSGVGRVRARRSTE